MTYNLVAANFLGPPCSCRCIYAVINTVHVRQCNSDSQLSL